MKLRTEIKIDSFVSKIDYSSRIFAIGSCFSENISDKLRYYNFETTSNPFGVIFNPSSIADIFDKISNNKKLKEGELFCNNEIWHSFDFHSKMSGIKKKEVLNNCNNTIVETHNFVKKATHIIITLGTSIVYKHKETNKIVANCHKFPSSQFDKKHLSINDIISNLNNIKNSIKSINKNSKITFTISPIRHLKEGFVQNNISKSRLVVALDEFLQYNNDCDYFPSYEILMDDLRDYRFYKNDFIHPSEMAVEYIWSKFKGSSVDESCYDTMKKVGDIKRDLAHKPFNKTSELYLKFVKSVDNKITNLKKEFPHWEF